jgi:hypothetical protein
LAHLIDDGRGSRLDTFYIHLRLLLLSLENAEGLIHQVA